MPSSLSSLCSLLWLFVGHSLNSKRMQLRSKADLIQTLLQVNYYGFARLAWDATLTPSQIYTEWIQRTFGPQLPSAAQESIHQLLTDSQEPATQLGLYHGYRGVWCKCSKALLPPSYHSVV